MSYPAGTPYEPQTEEEKDDFADAHHQDVEGASADAVSSDSGQERLEQLQLTMEDLQAGVIEDDPTEEQLNPRGHAGNENANHRGTGRGWEDDPKPHSFGRAEP